MYYLHQSQYSKNQNYRHFVLPQKVLDLQDYNVIFLQFQLLDKFVLDNRHYNHFDYQFTGIAVN